MRRDNTYNILINHWRTALRKFRGQAKIYIFILKHKERETAENSVLSRTFNVICFILSFNQNFLKSFNGLHVKLRIVH